MRTVRQERWNTISRFEEAKLRGQECLNTRIPKWADYTHVRILSMPPEKLGSQETCCAFSTFVKVEWSIAAFCNLLDVIKYHKSNLSQRTTVCDKFLA